MTKVSYIHGIPEDEYRQRGEEVPGKNYIQFGAMTDGELKLALLREQVNILRNFYPEVSDYQEAYNLLGKVLEEGLHSISYIPGYNGQIVRKAIRDARNLGRPAGGMFTINRKKGQGLAGLIPTDDCSQFLEWDFDRAGNEIQVPIQPQHRNCLEFNENARLLNEHLEPVSHHLLYEYIENANNVPQVVAAKYVQHQNAIGALSSMFSLRRDNLNLWLRNGVMRNNATHGGPPATPEQSIEALKLGHRQGMSIVESASSSSSGAAVSGFWAVFPVVLQAVAAAVAATVGLISALKAQKAQQLRTTAQGIGTDTFGPQQTDWPPPENTTNTDTDDENNTQNGSGGLLGGNTAPLLLGGAALLLLSNE